MRPATAALRGGLVVCALAVIASALPGQDAFDKDAFLSRKKWYLSFTLSLKGAGETNRPDKQGGYAKLEWHIDREVSGVVELDMPMPSQFPARHIPRDTAALMAAIAEKGRYIAWTIAPPKDVPRADPAAILRGPIPLAGNPLFVPVNYVINDTIQTEDVSYGEARSLTEQSGLTRIHGDGIAYMNRGGIMLACDLKEMMAELDLEGARAAVGFLVEETPTVKTQQETHSFEESLGESEDTVLPMKTNKPNLFLPGITETMYQKLWQKIVLREGRIAFTISEPVTKVPFGFTGVKKGGPPFELTLDAVLTPGPPSRAKLILTSDGYTAWRPRCSNSETTKGNDLQIGWRVEEEDGDPASPTEVSRVTFALQGTSKEPGVCLNYPVHPKTPADFDLKFAPKTSLTGYSVGSGGQTLTLSEAQVSARKGTVAVDCFDSGAWADLVVTAELADGRTLTGHLESDPTVSVITLPKRTGNSCIADTWKTEHGVTAGDGDDSEKLPSVGKAAGDGFTLYEEYRGFFENGKYVQGDPEKVDFFVRNYIGGDARPGIDLFARLTGAKVHDRLTDAEFDPAKRVLNANHRRGAHNKDQHGVFLRTEAGLNGAEARFTTASLRGRPGLCTGIFVQPREAQTSTATTENVPVSDLVFIYDQFVAHEMLHAVGVEHHGDHDYRLDPWLIFSDSPVNKTGKPYFQVSGGIVTITDEATGRDLAAKLEPDLLLQREKLRPIMTPLQGSYTAEEFEVLLNFFVGSYRWYVGVQQGECSGVEGCAMRYYFAKLYEKKGVANAYYYIGDKHTERAGLALCHSLTGTGINLSSRKPQSRYGDTDPGWGDCADWIVFNDAAPSERAPTHPPKKR